VTFPFSRRGAAFKLQASLIPEALLLWLLSGFVFSSFAAPFDAAPFGLPLPEGNGIMWEDPREIHQVVVHFADAPPRLERLRLEYWGSRWPEQHLPKDRQPGGGDVGWMELGNWYRGGWRIADTQATAEALSVHFTFRPISAKEFPGLTTYPVPFRYTLKLRVVSDGALPAVSRIETFTDSTLEPRGAVRIVWQKPPASSLQFGAFNGSVNSIGSDSPLLSRLSTVGAINPDPNTFDRTLVTIRNGQSVFTFALDDLKNGPLFLPEFGAAVLPDSDTRDYAAVEAAVNARNSKTLYERVAELPEQTWQSALSNVPPKKSHIYFPLGRDGGRQKFLLEADGSIRFRCNDHFLKGRPGQETPRFALEPAPVRFRFGPGHIPIERSLQEETLPICETKWETNGLLISQTAFVTELNGTNPNNSPVADVPAVFMAQFVFTNASGTAQSFAFSPMYEAGEASRNVVADDNGFFRLEGNLRGQITSARPLGSPVNLAPSETAAFIVKIPYVVLTEKSERDALARLDFETERAAVANYWRRRLDQSTRLITPEPLLNEFYRAHAGHLLINCEREPNSTRRVARVGSFSYGAYGNESCMMVVDLDQRGYHREAQECLDAWLHYQGTVGLPGDFSSQEGVLYGAGGYEAGGYNQHHGWILWCLAEHYRFTRDEAWLRSAAPGIRAGADWIVRETKRTAGRHELERGLLPAGSLEDIGDWWTWLSTSCYTWRGLDSAAWALEQLKHPEAGRIRQEADAYHTNLLANFRAAAERSPVVRLRDGTAVPHFPSYVHRRGRSFGWICETLEGALHLLITGALDSHSPEAEWILKDYEDNLYLSNQYGYTLDDFDKYWFGRGGMSMQACLLLDVEPYLYRDDVKHALRALFNALAVSHFPDVHMNTEHALPNFGDWRGDHYKTSDEANACGWLRQIFVREQGDELLLGQAVPREWLKPGQTCGLGRAATYFGPMTVLYTAAQNEITAQLKAPRRNPPKRIRLRFRAPNERPLAAVTVNGAPWKQFDGDWVHLPGDIGSARIVARY
jgi:hypothetical protein